MCVCVCLESRTDSNCVTVVMWCVCVCVCLESRTDCHCATVVMLCVLVCVCVFKCFIYFC